MVAWGVYMFISGFVGMLMVITVIGEGAEVPGFLLPLVLIFVVAVFIGGLLLIRRSKAGIISLLFYGLCLILLSIYSGFVSDNFSPVVVFSSLLIVMIVFCVRKILVYWDEMKTF